MKYTQWEKYEIIRLVEGSSLSVRKTLEQINVSRSSFYEWYCRYAEGGVEALANHTRSPRKFWNRIPDSERQVIIEHALGHPELSCREVAVDITDSQGLVCLRIERVSHPQTRRARGLAGVCRAQCCRQIPASDEPDQ